MCDATGVCDRTVRRWLLEIARREPLVSTPTRSSPRRYWIDGEAPHPQELAIRRNERARMAALLRREWGEDVAPIVEWLVTEPVRVREVGLQEVMI
jgi:hypothetical protein